MANQTDTAAGASADSTSLRLGLAYCVGAYVWWGVSGAYFKLLPGVPPVAVLCHRVVWSVLVLVVLLWWGRAWGEVRAAVRRRDVLAWLTVSSLLIAGNWLVFIYSAATNRLVESSLGFFINPLFTVILGMVFLKERLRPAQHFAAALATAALVYLAFTHGGVPWISLALPALFGFYSLIRKRTPVGPLAGLFVETAILGPAAMAYMIWAHTREGAAFNTAGTWGILSLAGVVTTLPMLWFIAAARRLPLTTVGFLQFINPTLQFLTAVVIFGEPFGRERAIAFSLIWVAVGVFIADSVRAGWRRRQEKASSEHRAEHGHGVVPQPTGDGP